MPQRRTTERKGNEDPFRCVDCHHLFSATSVRPRSKSLARAECSKQRHQSRILFPMRNLTIMEWCAMAKIPFCLRHEDGRATRRARTARVPHLVPAPAWQPVHHQLQAQVSATQPRGSDHCFTGWFLFLCSFTLVVRASPLCVMLFHRLRAWRALCGGPSPLPSQLQKGDVGSSQQLCIKGESQKIDISFSDSRKTSQQEEDAARQPQSQESDAHTQAQDPDQKTLHLM